MIESFSIKISEQSIQDLKMRLKLTRWTDEIVNSGWSYGAKLSYVKEITDYWLNTFDWRNTENEINRYPNYIAEINGVKIHFLHIKSKEKNQYHLLLLMAGPALFWK